MFQTKDIEELKKEIEQNAVIEETLKKQVKNQEEKIKERKQVVMNYFKELTGKELSEAEFELYNSCFEKAKEGYNIKSFIREMKIELLNELETKEDNGAEC